MKKKRIIVSIPTNIYKILQKYKKFSGISISSIIQMGLNEYLINVGFLDFTDEKIKYKEIKCNPKKAEE